MKRLCAIAVVVSATLCEAQAQEVPIEWPYVGSEQSHTKYSAATDITRANVTQLEVAWEWEVGELPLPESGTRPGAFQATPIMIDNVLYVSTMYNRVVALDAETGEEHWAFDPGSSVTNPRGVSPGGFKHRGIAFWRDGDERRIFLNSRNHLYAIDARTGVLVSTFGENGRRSLIDGHGRPIAREDFDQSSPPVVYEDLVIVGSRVPDRVQRRFDPPGSVQAFDTRTGERRWIFFTVPQSNDDFGADTWENESWRYTGHANVWGLMSLDDERGLLYVPTSTASNACVIRLRKKRAQLPTDPTPTHHSSPSSNPGDTFGTSADGIPARQRYVSTSARSIAVAGGSSCSCAAAAITANAAPKGLSSSESSSGDGSVPRYPLHPDPWTMSPSPPGPTTTRMSSRLVWRRSCRPYG